MKTRIGLEVLQSNPSLSSSWGRCTLLCNQASVTDQFRSSYEIIGDILGSRLKSLLGPQHGFWGTEQDNMLETEDSTFLDSSLPIFSLYSRLREPSKEMLDNIDTIVVDLQIVGCRIYTFKSTIAGCLRSAKKYGKKVVILDRPNPLGGIHVEGRCIDQDMKSFVGQFVMPMRHGLTAAEAALFFNREIGAEIEVVELEGWDPHSLYHQIGRRWVVTSPNLPTLEPVFVYPGMVIFEGTNLSEGRGTNLPFQYIGAPYIKNPVQFKNRILDYLGQHDLQGLYLREAYFKPTSGKWKDELCGGCQIHVTVPEQVTSFVLALAILKASIDIGEQAFKWTSPPYEYEYDKLPMSIILGSAQIEARCKPIILEDGFWKEGLKSYIEQVKPVLCYERSMTY